MVLAVRVFTLIHEFIHVSNWGNWYGSSGTSNKGSASAFFLNESCGFGFICASYVPLDDALDRFRIFEPDNHVLICAGEREDVNRQPRYRSLLLKRWFQYLSSTSLPCFSARKHDYHRGTKRLTAQDGYQLMNQHKIKTHSVPATHTTCLRNNHPFGHCHCISCVKPDTEQLKH